MATQTPSWLQKWGWLLLLLTVFALFGSTLTFKEFTFDERFVIEVHPMTRPGWSLKKIFLSNHWGIFESKRAAAQKATQRPPSVSRPQSAHLQTYRPITSTLRWFQYLLWGKALPGYHLVQLLLFFLICLLVGRLARQLGFSPPIALLASFLFALLPVHTSSVVSAAGLGDLLTAFFLLCAILLHAQGGILARAGALLCVLLGLGSKEPFAIALGVLIALDFFAQKQREVPWGERLRKLPWLSYTLYLLATIGYIAARHVVTAGSFRRFVSYGFTDNPLSVEPLWIRLLNTPGIFLRYLFLLLSPTNLSVDRTFNTVPVYYSVLNPWLWGGIAAVLLLALLLWHLRHRPAFLFLASFAACTYFIPSNLLLVTPTIMADRWLFLPSIPFSIALASGLYTLYHLISAEKMLLRRTFQILTAGYCLVLMMLTADYTWHWRNTEALCTYSLQSEPDNLKVRFWVVRYHLITRQWKQALGHIQRAFAIPGATPYASRHMRRIIRDYRKVKNENRARWIQAVLQRALQNTTNPHARPPGAPAHPTRAKPRPRPTNPGSPATAHTPTTRTPPKAPATQPTSRASPNRTTTQPSSQPSKR